ncbi:MAG: four helix bundle protein [Dehalococcoidia bacterium]|nr:four helix bundle protein [Dehalococcoidia bacterium]
MGASKATGGSGDTGSVHSFRNSLLWQRSQDLAVDVIAVSRLVRKDDAGRSVIRQLIASAGSVAANIAEGHGRYSVAAYRNHLSIARGSVAETESWIDLLHRSGYIDAATERPLVQECEAIIAALTSAMRRLEARLNEGKPGLIREETAEYGLYHGEVAEAEPPDFAMP